MNNRFIRKIMAGAVSLATVATLVGTSPAITASAVENLPGYTVNGTVAYRDRGSGVYDIHGYVNEAWRTVTYDNEGIYPIFYGASKDNFELTVEPQFGNGGKSLNFIYKVKNISSESQTFVFAIAADTEVNDNDHSANTVNASHTTLLMSYDGVSFWGFSGDAGFTIVPTYYYYTDVSYCDVTEGGVDPRTVTEELDEGDSAFVAYWNEITLAPGQTKAFNFSTAVTIEGEDIFAVQAGDINTVNIGGFTLDTWEDILVYMPEMKMADLVEVNEANSDFFHVDITNLANMYVPAAVVQALANSDTTGLHVFIGGGDAITFMKGYNYTDYSTMYFNHTDVVTADSHTIDFDQKKSIGGTVVLHTNIGDAGKAATVYKVVDGQEMMIASCVSNADGMICFKITETAKYVVKY